MTPDGSKSFITSNADNVVVVNKTVTSGLRCTQRLITGRAVSPSPKETAWNQKRGPGGRGREGRPRRSRHRRGCSIPRNLRKRR